MRFVFAAERIIVCVYTCFNAGYAKKAQSDAERLSDSAVLCEKLSGSAFKPIGSSLEKPCSLTK